MDSALTPTDVMLMTKHRGNATATTGVALASGLGGGALLLAIAGLWGMNQASKSRSRSAEQIAAANARTAELLAQKNADSINTLSAALLAERNSREDWQRRNQPSIGQYVDVQTNPNLNASLMDYVQTMASAQATANAIAQANAPLNSAVGTESFLKVQRYSAPQPCGCDTCNG